MFRRVLVTIFNVNNKTSFCRRLCIAAIIFICISIYTTININPDIIKCDISHEIPCYRTPEHLRRLVKFAEDVTMVMDKLNMTSFLLYGSLWGVYRFHGPLPWDHDIDLGVIGDDNFYAMKDTLVEELVNIGFYVRDDWSTSSYKVLPANQTGHLGIFIFIDYYGTMKRPGLEPWLFSLHYRIYHSFPAWMAETPLPKAKFAGYNAWVPRGGREILKHLYPFTWRDVDLPVTCEGNGTTLQDLKTFMDEKVNIDPP
ncbi:Hypothetical predicted protein [Paramuricea clavata]|uniref:LicD/FKTN/FKRP nucleotidyltransferase domain-containing protein n=1 Tax=Paramuricea clavata TaxID=317549 RepID=A0A6S7FQN0_PARCT|nr:Hypothetical predicted protein [Paramuricea clavata]